jgi:hypothetical protein
MKQESKQTVKLYSESNHGIKFLSEKIHLGWRPPHLSGNVFFFFLIWLEVVLVSFVVHRFVNSGATSLSLMHVRTLVFPHCLPVPLGKGVVDAAHW